MSRFRSDQGWQKVMGSVQRAAFRPTCAEKVRRLKPAPLLASSNLLTSSNLAARTHPRTRAYMHTRARLCARIPVRYVRRLDSSLIQQEKIRPTYQSEVRRMKGGWT